MEQDFDALVEASWSAVNKLGEQALWKAATNLPMWFFVADKAGEEGEPIIAAVEGKPHVLVFTDETRAYEFAKAREKMKGAESPVMSVEIEDALAYFKQLDEAGVQGALFNSGKFAFQSGFIRLTDMVHRYRGK